MTPGRFKRLASQESFPLSLNSFFSRPFRYLSLSRLFNLPLLDTWSCISLAFDRLLFAKLLHRPSGTEPNPRGNRRFFLQIAPRSAQFVANRLITHSVVSEVDATGGFSSREALES